MYFLRGIFMDDPAYIEPLEKIKRPFLPKGKRAFSIKEDALLPMKEDAYVFLESKEAQVAILISMLQKMRE